jgi:ATP-binding cassette subfamily B protein
MAETRWRPDVPLQTALWALRRIRAASPGLLIGLASLTLVQGLLPAGLALALRGLIDAAVAAIDAGAASATALYVWLGIAFSLAAADALSSLAVAYMNRRMVDELNIEVTGDILDHAQILDLAFFEDPLRQNLITRTQSNTAVHLQTFVAESLAAVRNLLSAASLLAVLVLIDPLVLVVVPPFAIPFLYFQAKLARQRFTEEHQRAEKRRWTTYFVSKLTSSDSVAEVRLLGLGPLLAQRFRTLLREFRDRDRHLHLRNFRGTAVAALLTIAALYAIFVRVALRSLTGTASLGDLAIFGGAAVRLRLALNEAIRSGTGAFEHVLFVENLREFLGAPPTLASRAMLRPPLDRGEIRIEDVTFTYPGATEPVLRGVSLTIEAGKTVALVGENGAGKSTLVKLIARLYDPDEGRILLDGADLRDIDPAHLHRHMGLVLQSFGRYEASVAENLAYGDWPRLRDDRAAIRQLAARVQLDERFTAMADGYDTHLGRSFGQATLSGGEWQRLAVARALARNASLLILDEPTASFDARTEHDLFVRFKELSRGRTTLLISHRFTTIGTADRIAVLDGGRIVESGSHDDLLARRGAYASLYELYERLIPGAAGPGSLSSP